MPVDYTFTENPDGSATVVIGETDRINGTKGNASMTLYPDKAYIEIRGRLFNPTDYPQTFLWWANPAVWQAGGFHLPHRHRRILQSRLFRRRGYFPV